MSLFFAFAVLVAVVSTSVFLRWFRPERHAVQRAFDVVIIAELAYAAFVLLFFPGVYIGMANSLSKTIMAVGLTLFTASIPLIILGAIAKGAWVGITPKRRSSKK
jgi:hypothetical protein